MDYLFCTELRELESHQPAIDRKLVVLNVEFEILEETVGIHDVLYLM